MKYIIRKLYLAVVAWDFILLGKLCVRQIVTGTRGTNKSGVTIWLNTFSREAKWRHTIEFPDFTSCSFTDSWQRERWQLTPRPRFGLHWLKCEDMAGLWWGLSINGSVSAPLISDSIPSYLFITRPSDVMINSVDFVNTDLTVVLANWTHLLSD